MVHQPSKIVWVGNDSQTGFDTEQDCKEGGLWSCWKCYDTSDDDGEDGVVDVHDLIADYINIASIIFGSVGIIWNLLCIYILSQSRHGTRFSQLLIVLALPHSQHSVLCPSFS